MNLIGKTLWVQNAALSYGSNTWMSCGIPENANDGPIEAVDSGGTAYPVVLDGKELFVRVPLNGGQKKSLTLRAATTSVPLGTRTGSQGATIPTARASWALDDLRALLPTFRATYDSVVIEAPQIAILSTKMNAARMRIEFKTRFAECPLFVHGWFDIFDNQELVEFNLLISWGSVDGDGANDSAQRLGQVTMHTVEQPFIDHWRNKGLTPPAFNGTTWSALLVDTQTWSNRAGRFECGSGIRILGALRCLPPQSEWNPAMLADARYLDARHREQGKAQCMLDRSHWQGSFGAFGYYPVIGSSAAARTAALNAFYTKVYTRAATVSNENPATIAYSNFPNSSSTGAQPDFGAAKCEHIMGYNEPGAIYWHQRDLDGWFRRPYHHKNPDGTYIHEKNHTSCRTYNLFPDERNGSDTLGWDHPQQHGAYWWAMNEQHRSENLLMGMYLLTRDPAIEVIVRNTIALMNMSYWQYRTPGPVGASIAEVRGWGRPLIAACHQYQAGFREAEFFIRACVERMWNDACFRDPALAGATMKPLSRVQHASGYVNELGQDIYGVSSFQEGIGIMGLYAAWRMFPDLENALTMVLNAGETMVNHLIYEYGGSFYLSYVYGWNGGEPWPASQLYPSQPNYSIYTSNSFFKWVQPAIAIYNSLVPSARAEAILAQIGPSYDLESAGWYAAFPQPEL